MDWCGKRVSKWSTNFLINGSRESGSIIFPVCRWINVYILEHFARFEDRGRVIFVPIIE
jgi:hypothetical protein